MEGPGGKQTYVVELAGNELSVRPPRGGRWPLVAGSEKVFWVTGQRLEFFVDANGQATHFVMTIVEGDLEGRPEVTPRPRTAACRRTPRPDG